MNIEDNIRNVIENQALILERLSTIESHLEAVFQVQANFLAGLEQADEAKRADLAANYSRLPQTIHEGLQQQNQDRFRPFQP